MQISKATENNWKKLDSDTQDKLKKRANKTQSDKRVVAGNYLDFGPANELLSNLLKTDQPIGNIIYSLCISCLKHAGIFGKKNVKSFLASQSGYDYFDIKLPANIWDTDQDVLGFIYQSLITEGERNKTGQYYTNKMVVDYMTNGLSLTDNQSFLDPCCGSGAFLLAVKTNNPSLLYGFDINPIAVLIASTNLLVKYSAYDFIPNIFCLDFLQNNLFAKKDDRIPSTFDYIYTNPPWGADKSNEYTASYPMIKSKERSSMMLVKSLSSLKKEGVLYFLLPTSLLKIKTHNDVRRYILTHTSIKAIDLFNDRFDGVFTDYFSIKITNKSTTNQTYNVTRSSGSSTITLSKEDQSKGNIVIEQLSDAEETIIRKIEALRNDNLSHSKWALGIVTGNNSLKVKKEKGPGMEPVYIGKQVSPFKLQSETSYILFDPKSFQQCAKEEFYRAPEKLIYRFIAKYPIMAYDDKKCLCLNSANILIPDVQGLSVKSVAALLNSSLYRYYYSTKFSDIKVLKGSLEQLPFPKINQDQDKELSKMVTDIISSDHQDELIMQLDDYIYSLFGITPLERQQVQKRITPK